MDVGILTNPSDHVHHIDGDKLNNDISNLEVYSCVDHALKHTESGSLIRNQYGTFIAGEGTLKKNLQKRVELGQRLCEECGSDITPLWLDAIVCGQACRMRRWKRNKR